MGCSFVIWQSSRSVLRMASLFLEMQDGCRGRRSSLKSLE